MDEMNAGNEEVTAKPEVLTAQEALNRVVRGMKAQGWKKAAMGGEQFGTCKYRTSSGLRCAVGQLIPTETYKPEMEGKPIATVLRMADIAVDDQGVIFMLIKLQEWHDLSNGPLDMHRRFCGVARHYGLEFPADCLAAQDWESL